MAFPFRFNRCSARGAMSAAFWLTLLVQASFAQDNLKHGVVYYTGPQGAPPETNAVIAARYGVGITGIEIGRHAQDIKNLNPDFQWYVYNSATDNYVAETNPEQISIQQIAAQYGWDPEEAYLHYYDDTEVTISGEAVFVPGWGGGTALTKAQARVPVYYADLSRCATNFSTPTSRYLNKKVIVRGAIDETFHNIPLHADGVFLDNSGSGLLKTGTVVSGGHVLEAPPDLVAGTASFFAWYWNNGANGGLGPFLGELKDTLQTAASWGPDGKRKYSMINVGPYWTDDYVTMDAADVLFLEFEYSPVRATGWQTVQRIWQQDQLAASAGIRLFYAPRMATEIPPNPGKISYGEALLGCLSWTLTTRSDESLLFLFGSSVPTAAGWDTLTWRGCVDVVKSQLGHYTANPYIYSEGTDPTGKPYKVWARPYENGLVLLRNRGSWNEGIEPETAVPVALPGSMTPVSPSGVLGDPTTTALMRNGTGAIFLGDAGPPPPPPPAPVAAFTGAPQAGEAPLSVTFTDQSTNNPTLWLWDFGDGTGSTQRNPVHTYSTSGSFTVSLTATNAGGSDSEIKTGFIVVTQGPPPPAPVAAFTATPQAGESPLDVTFTDQSTNNPTSWLWDFGDGETSTQRNRVHTYSTAGSFTVSLTVTNAGGSDSEIKTDFIVVTQGPPPPAPVAAFMGTPLTGESPLDVTFTDQSTNNPTSWIWDFGDGATSTQRNPVHAYAAAGNFTVSLTVTSASGSDSETKTGYVAVAGTPGDITRLGLAPNPSAGSMRLVYSRSVAGSTRLHIFDVSGREVASPSREDGAGRIVWEIGDVDREFQTRLGDGAYYYRLDLEPETVSGRFVLLRGRP